MISLFVTSLAVSRLRELLYPVAHGSFADPKRFADANAGWNFIPFGRSEVMNPVFLPDGVKGVDNIAGHQRKTKIRVDPSRLRQLRTANGEAGRDHVLEIFLENFAHEINGSFFRPRIEKNRAFARQERVVVVRPVSASDGIVAEAAECRVKLAERCSVWHLRKERGHRIVAGIEGIGNHPKSSRQFDRRVAHDVLRTMGLGGNPVETGAKLLRFRVHILDSGPVRTGVRNPRPLPQVGRCFDFKRSADWNLELQLERTAFKTRRVGETRRAAVADRPLAEERGDEALCLGHGMDTHTKDTIVINPDIKSAIMCDSILSTGCATRFFGRRAGRYSPPLS